MSKQASPDLFQLISSMNGSEKRYFKIFSERHTIGDQNRYPLLFDAFLATKDYDEKEFIKKNPNLVRDHFADQKQNLYELILRSNVNFHYKATIDLELYHNLAAAQLLFRKGLFLQSRKVLLKAKKKALYYERFLLTLEILALEKQLAFTLFDLKKTKKEAKELNDETERVRELFNNALSYRMLAEKMYLVLSEESFLRSKKNKLVVGNIMKNALMRDPRNALSVDAQFSYHRAMGFYSYMTDKPRDFYLLNVKILELINDNPHLVNNLIRSKITAYQNILIGLKNTGEYSKAVKMIEEFKALPTESHDQNVELFSITTDIELTLYIDTGNFSEGTLAEAKLRKDLDHYGKDMRAGSLAIIYFNISYILIADRKFKSAIKWLNKIISDKSVQSPPDTFSMAKLLSMLAHLEVKDFDQIEYYLKPTSNFLERNEKFHLLEKALLKFFSAVIDPEKRRRMKDLYLQLQNELQVLAKHPTQKNALNYFDFLSWIKSKVEETTMEEVVKDSRKNPDPEKNGTGKNGVGISD